MLRPPRETWDRISGVASDRRSRSHWKSGGLSGLMKTASSRHHGADASDMSVLRGALGVEGIDKGVAVAVPDGGHRVKRLRRNWERHRRAVDGPQDTPHILRRGAAKQHQQAALGVFPAAVELDEQPVGLPIVKVVVMDADCLSGDKLMRGDLRED